jgi:hypothetical protein
MSTALKPGAPFVFTYHHNRIDAYFPIAVAMLDAGLTCTASLPCPAEMGGSIHISGTGSSVVDTIFVCRSTGVVRRNYVVDDPLAIAALVLHDINELKASDYLPTRGDIRCLIFGHLIRLAVWKLRQSWSKVRNVEERLLAVEEQITALGSLEGIEQDIAAAENESQRPSPRAMVSARSANQFS